MHTETLEKSIRMGLRVFLMVCVLFALLAFSGCRKVSEENTNFHKTVTATNPALENIAHFRDFELAVPEDWSVRGNLGKIYEGNSMFLLVGPLEGNGDCTAVEEKISEELELFYNTEYYRTMVRLEYEKEWTDGAMNRLTGTLYNDRNATSLHFTGVYCEAPGMYCFYFWQNSDQDREGEQDMEMTYESIRFL